MTIATAPTSTSVPVHSGAPAAEQFERNRKQVKFTGMALCVKRKDFLDKLLKVRHAVAAKATLPILSHVLLVAEKGKLTLIANNLEFQLNGICKAAVTRNGATAVPQRMLEDVFKRLPSDTIGIKVTGTRTTWEHQAAKWNDTTKKCDYVWEPRMVEQSNVLIESGNATLTIDAAKAADFPMTEPLKEQPITITALDTAIDKVSYAAEHTESGKPVLESICLTPKKNVMELAAADGFRLAVTSTRMRGKLEHAVLLPIRSAEIVRKLFPGTVRMQVHTPPKDKSAYEMLSFSQEKDLIMFCRPMLGAFPDYKQLIPTKGTRFSAKTKELRDAVNTVMSIKPGTHMVRFLTKGRQVVVSAREDERLLEVKLPASGRIKHAFNGNFVKDLLDQSGETFTFRLGSSEKTSPCFTKDNGATHVLMPMNVAWN